MCKLCVTVFTLCEVWHKCATIATTMYACARLDACVWHVHEEGSGNVRWGGGSGGSRNLERGV